MAYSVDYIGKNCYLDLSQDASIENSVLGTIIGYCDDETGEHYLVSIVSKGEVIKIYDSDIINIIEDGGGGGGGGSSESTIAWKPTVAADGTISWARTSSTTKPASQNIKGPQGEDGYSPTVTITEITGGHEVTITDKDGDHSFNVMDGSGSGDGGTMGESFTTNIDVGGISSGSNINAADKIAAVIKRMLTTVYYPTFTSPSASLSFSSPNLVKVGSSLQAATAIINYNAGAIMLNGTKQNNRAGAANNYSISTSGADTNYNNSGNNNSFSVPSLTRSTKGNITISGTVGYDKGPQPKDSNGNDYGSPLMAGSVNTPAKTIEFILPFYHGVSNVSDNIDLSTMTEDLSKRGNKSYSYTTNSQYVIIAYDESYGDLTSILDQNGFETISGYNKSQIIYDGQNYTAYISKLPTTDVGAINTFKF